MGPIVHWQWIYGMQRRKAGSKESKREGDDVCREVRETDRQTDRQTDIQTHRKTEIDRRKCEIC